MFVLPCRQMSRTKRPRRSRRVHENSRPRRSVRAHCFEHNVWPQLIATNGNASQALPRLTVDPVVVSKGFELRTVVP